MPYIDKSKRNQLGPVLKELADILEEDMDNVSGNLNYSITKVIDTILADKGFNYDRLNSVIGMLECCKLELSRRVVAPYEDTKINQNGDAYSFSNISKNK